MFVLNQNRLDLDLLAIPSDYIHHTKKLTLLSSFPRAEIRVSVYCVRSCLPKQAAPLWTEVVHVAVIQLDQLWCDGGLTCTCVFFTTGKDEELH